MTIIIMPYKWFKNYKVTLENCEIIDCDNMLVIENEDDIEYITDVQIDEDTFKRLVPNPDDIVCVEIKSKNIPAETKLQFIRLFKYDLYFINCKKLKTYDYNEYNNCETNIFKKGCVIQYDNNISYTTAYNNNNIFIKNCNKFEIIYMGKICLTARDHHCTNTDIMFAIVRRQNEKLAFIERDGLEFLLSPRLPLHKRHHDNSSKIPYYYYHNVYIDGVQVIDPELPSFKKLKDEITLSRNIITDLTSEIDKLKLQMLIKNDEIDKLKTDRVDIEELKELVKIQSNQIKDLIRMNDVLEKSIGVYYEKLKKRLNST